MKKYFSVLFAVLACLLSACGKSNTDVAIAATTLPVYDFTKTLCQGTDLTVQRLITESVSCLHDYALNVDQVRTAESAQTIVLSGAGLEDFMEDILPQTVIDSSKSILLLHSKAEHDHDALKNSDDHEMDPHIWLNPQNAKMMVQNICDGLCLQFPQYKSIFQSNMANLIQKLNLLDAYGKEQLKSLSSRELITFHDGFAYFADAFNLTILDAVEEESGSEAPAQELIHLITMVQEHNLPAIFIEKNGSPSAASVISAETQTSVYALDMAMSDTDYFTAMYHNIDIIKEALG